MLLMVLLNLNQVIAAEQKQLEEEQLPSLDLLLYLGEFQDRDGSLLEPEQFDSSLKLDNNEQVKIEDLNNEKLKTKTSNVKKEDDYEKSQP